MWLRTQDNCRCERSCRDYFLKKSSISSCGGKVLKMNAIVFVKALEKQLRQCVILSTVYWMSQCVADKKFDIPGKDDDFVHVYTLIPNIRPFEKEHGMARVWIVVLGVLGGIVLILTCIFCYFALQRRPFFRSSPVSNPPPVPEFRHPAPSAPAVEERDSWNRASSRSQGPPEYTSVVLGPDSLSAPGQPQKLETPPPAYMTVAPFQ